MSAATGQLFPERTGDKAETLSRKVSQEQQKFLQLVQTFYDKEERSKQQALELSKEIIVAIDNIIKAGDWDDSLFLRTTIRPLRELRREVVATRDSLMEEQGLVEITEYQPAEDEVKVYVSLYQADGHNLQKWEAQLASIDCYMAGRPIYKNEADIKKTIRQKLLQMSEGYAVVLVKKNQLLSQGFDQRKTDRYGHELLTIESGVINSEKVIGFSHGGRNYFYHKQRLILKK